MKNENRSGPAWDAANGVPGRGWNSMRKALRAFRKRGLLVFVCFLIVTALMCGWHYAVSLRTAGTVLSLDYEEASRGLTPNGTRFNIFEIRSGEVMERLISLAGLEGKTTADELSKCVSIQATHDKSIRGSVNYISTSFTVRFTNDGAIEGRSPEDMLSLLCKAYCEYFVEHYGYNHSILSFDVDDLKFNDEYLTTVDLLELKCSQLEKYAQLRARESKNYRDPETGVTFSSLEQRAKDIYGYDIARLRSYIIENGITNDRTGLKGMLDYKMRMDRLTYDKMMAAYDEDNKGIRMYDAAMSAVVMIPTQDQSSKYYMSRTKTGMDNMAIHADEQLRGAAERMEQIEYNTYLTGKLETSVSDRTKTEKADAMIAEVTASLEKLAEDIRKADSAYTNARARNYIGFSEDRVGIAERFGIVPSFACAALLLAAAFTCVYLKIFLSGKEKEA